MICERCGCAVGVEVCTCDKDKRIAELEAKITAMTAEVRACGFMFAWHEKDKPTLAIVPGSADLIRKIYGL